MSIRSDQDVPQELEETFEKFTSSLEEVQSAIKPLLETPRNKMLQNLSPMEVAKLDLVSVYAINSLFWSYLITQGINPRTHPIKGELDRIRIYMGKIKEIEDRGKAPTLEKGAAKRMVRNAMFDLEEKNKERRKVDENEKTMDSSLSQKRHIKHKSSKSHKKSKKK